MDKKEKKKSVPKFERDMTAHSQAHAGLVANETSPLCLKCGLHDNGAKNPYLEPSGAEASPLITVIVDGISKGEDEAALIGSTGTAGLIKKLIGDAAEELKLDTKRIRYVSLTRCANRDFKLKVNLKTKGNWCRWFTVDDIVKTRPQMIFAVGTIVLGALCHKSNAQDWSGKLLTWRGWPDDWITNPKFADGHPTFGRRPIADDRIPLFALQSPRIVYSTQNPRVIKKWRDQLKRGLELAISGVKPLDYTRPWWRLSVDPDDIERTLRSIPDGIRVQYDTETTGLEPFRKGSKIVFHMFRWVVDGQTFSIGFPWDYAESPLFTHVKRLTPVVLDTLYRVLIEGHNLSFDVLFNAGTLEGADLNKLTAAMGGDTLHKLYTLRQDVGSRGLELIAYEWAPTLAGYEEEMVMLISQFPDLLDPAAGKGGHYAKCPTDKWGTHLKPYVMGDVEVVGEGSPAIDAKLASSRVYQIPLAHTETRGKFRWFEPPRRDWVYSNIMLPAQRTLTAMMARGMHVDVAEVAVQEDIMPKAIVEFKSKLRRSHPNIVSWSEQLEATDPDWKFDLESKDQLKTVLYDLMGLPIKHLTKAGRQALGEDADLAKIDRETLIKFASTDKFTLSSLAADHENVRPLIDYRKMHKAYTTYVRSMRNHTNALVDKKPRTKPPYLMDDVCVHAQFNQTGTRSGRLSCVAGDTIIETNLGPVIIGKLDETKLQHVTIKSHSGNQRQIVRRYRKGFDQMFKVVLSSGRSITCTAKHGVLTPTGWYNIGDLEVGSLVFTDKNTTEQLEREAPYRAVVCKALSSIDVVRLAAQVDWGIAAVYPGVAVILQDEIWKRVKQISSRAISSKNAWKQARFPSTVSHNSEKESCEVSVGWIVSIVPVGIMDVWDIEVEEDHSYWAGGLINHNSSQPNLQQLPRESIVKRMYDSRFGALGCLYQGDLSQIELRLIACACGDPTMVDAYARKVDLHSLTTSKIFGIEYEKFEKEYMSWLQKNGKDKEAKDLDIKRKIGKCVDPDTLIEVNGKITRIGDLHPGRDTDTFYDLEQQDLFTRAPDKAVKINKFYCNGVSDRVLVCARHGIVACSLQHRFLTEDGRLVMAKDLKKRDVLSPITGFERREDGTVVNFDPFGCGPAICSNYSVMVDSNMAYLLGLFYGDGVSSIGSIGIATGGDSRYFEWQDYIAKVAKKAGLTPSIKRTLWDSSIDGSSTVKSGPFSGRTLNGSYGVVWIGSTRVSDLFVQLGAVTNSETRSRTLRIPTWLLNSNYATKISFLAGLIDTDGSSLRGGGINITTKSWILAQDIMVLMRSIGITHSLEPSWNKTYKKYYFRINVTVRDSWKHFNGKLNIPHKASRLKKPKFEYKREKGNTVLAIIGLDPGQLLEINVNSYEHIYCASGLACRNTANFLTGYGGGPLGLQTSLAQVGVYLQFERCEEIIESFFDAYPSLRRHIGLYKDFILKHGVAVSIFGRVRVFEEVFSDDRESKSKALRSGYNHLIQSTASDLMLICLSVIEQLMRDANLQSMLVSTVHDSLVIDALRSELPQVHEICDQVLNNIPEILKLVFGETYDTSWILTPLGGDFEIGTNYLDQVKITDANPDWDKLLSPKEDRH